MSEQSTYIKLDRGILKWGWYKDGNTFRVFVHLLLNANYKESEFLGTKVRRGCVATSYAGLADDLGISIGKVRTALKHLQETGEIEVKRHRNFSVIRVINYAKYQNAMRKPKAPPTEEAPKEAPAEIPEDDGLIHPPVRKVYGLYGINSNVALTADEYKALTDSYPSAENIIDRVSKWLAQDDHKKAKNHYKLCEKFANDGNSEKEPEIKPNAQLEGILKKIDKVF